MAYIRTPEANRAACMRWRAKHLAQAKAIQKKYRESHSAHIAMKSKWWQDNLAKGARIYGT